MNRRSFWTAAGLVLVLTMPFAGATWYTRGSFEPDTPEDVSGGYMWADSDKSSDPGVRKLYFNAVIQDRNGISVNPNVAKLEGRYLPLGSMGVRAYLGVWKDCNADDYLGMAQGAVLDYRSELLLDQTICPPGSPHNLEGWVSEFIYVGDVHEDRSPNFPRVIKDVEARVWGDFGSPSDPANVHYDCAQAPLPTGTFDSTGGLLVYVDCQLGYNVARIVNDEVDPNGELGLRFEDRYHPERDCKSRLNQGVPTGVYGNHPCNDDTGTLEKSDDSMFTVWDCNEPGGTADITNPADGSSVRKVPAARPAIGNPHGSLSSGMDNFQRGSTQGCRSNTTYWSNVTYLESDFSATNPTDGKRMTDFWFNFQNPGHNLSRSGDPAPKGQGNFPLGIAVQDMPAWSSSVTYLPPTYLGGTIRNSDLSPASAIFFTFYAKVGVATKSAGVKLPVGDGVATYGVEACPVIGPGVSKTNNWDCDPTHWWNPSMGGTANAKGMRPGDTYNMRDVDCYDGSVTSDAPVYASLALLSAEGPCAVMPK